VDSYKTGIVRATAAYVAWGLFPFYWKQVVHVPAGQVIAHRIFWSFVTLALLAIVTGATRGLFQAITLRIAAVYACAAALVSANWLAYIWAVNHGWIVETSLGYFINPLVSVLLGVLFFHERLRTAQWAAVGLAFAGVAYLTWTYGAVPWIACVLAVTFAFYGLVKKLAPLAPMQGLTLETALAAIPAAAYLMLQEQAGVGSYGHDAWVTTALLTGAGAVTTLPLALFSTAVRQVPLTVIGLLQYIAPTLQLAAGVLVYREPFSRDQLFGFSCVWAGLAMFGWDAFRQRTQA
jgi:chloramphenicol-sensitive protein RarD